MLFRDTNDFYTLVSKSKLTKALINEMLKNGPRIK